MDKKLGNWEDVLGKGKMLLVVIEPVALSARLDDTRPELVPLEDIE